MLLITLFMLARGIDMTNMLKDNWQRAFFILTSLVWFGAYLGVLIVALGRKVSTKTVVYMSLGLIMLDGAMGIGTRVMGMDIGPSAIATFIISHFIACCLFPWTIRQAIIPVAVIASASLLSHVVIEGHSVFPALVLTFALMLSATPGVIIIAIKHSQRIQRSTNKFLNQRYGMLRQELAYARQVHEALFPAPQATGNIRFAYQYEPMRQIGGDYLYTKFHTGEDGKNEKLSVVIIDVTGHGIPAALTVNRLHGEIDISFAENPDITPGEMLAKLNKYVHLTLAKHSIYATAVCLRVDHKRGVVEYASGGHPPAFIRGVDGTLRDLDPTTFVLGACSEEDFDSEQIEADLMPGDSLIVYTDGAIEARATDGKMMLIGGLRKILAGGNADSNEQGVWAQRILDEVTAYRGGLPPDDDTLAIEIYLPIVTDESEAQESFEQEPVADANEDSRVDEDLVSL